MKWKDLETLSYVPYSKKPAYCFIESDQGSLFPGVRIENIAFPDTISAIQAAVFSCLSEGHQPAVLHIPDEESDQLEYWVREFDLSVASGTEVPHLPLYSVLKHTPESVQGRLKQLLSSARVTYSDFPVSALLFTGQGVIEGVNIEVKDWSMGLCAERVALAKAISSGYTNFTGMSVHTLYGEFSSPCGACRQVLSEHMREQQIELHHADGSVSVHLVQDLLPFNFSSVRLAERSQ